MTDATYTDGIVETASAPITKLLISVVKSGTSKQSVEVDTERLPDTYYTEALKQGLKVMVNGGASKITKEAYPEDSERFEAARALAAKRVEEMYESKLKIAGQKAASSGVDSKTMTEARRIARDIVKDELKKAGYKVSHYSASEITKAANSIIEGDPSILETAKQNLENRGSSKASSAIAALIPDPKLVAKAEEEKAAKAANKIPLSAKQAGMTKSHISH